MKLSHVLLLIIFSGIFSVGVVIDISLAESRYDEDMPYETYVRGLRSGGDEDRLHVYMYARASSTDRARNGTLVIEFALDNALPERLPISPVNRHYWHSDSRTFPFEENGGYVQANAYGLDTGGAPHSASARIDVPPMPPPTPQQGTDPEPQVGITSTDSDDTASPGETHDYRLITDAPYYWVGWYVKAPWDTSDRGSFITDELGDGTKTESTFSYTYPSGSMHTGDFLITAVIYRWSDMSQYEETYTETVSLE